jgi:hypothetical protein
LRILKVLLGKITGIVAILALCAAAVPAKAIPKTPRRQSSAARTSKTVKTVKKGTRSTKSTARKGRSRKSAKASYRTRGQQTIDNQRAQEIQAALIRANYLDGEPSGAWDQRTKDAMARFQAAHGWQTKVLPDSRALIKLGLGPKHSGLINPERTSINQPNFGGESDTPSAPQAH